MAAPSLSTAPGHALHCPVCGGRYRRFLPFAPAAFDVVICSHVLEHVADDRAAMGGLFRVPASGGGAAVMAPIDMKRSETYAEPAIDSAAGRHAAFGHPYHVRICGADYPERLRAAGFHVRAVNSEMLPRHGRWRWHITGTVPFDCRKPT